MLRCHIFAPHLTNAESCKHADEVFGEIFGEEFVFCGESVGKTLVLETACDALR